MGEVVRKVSEAANNEAVLVTDVGQNQMFGCRYFKFTKERSVITSGGCGTMGFGIPAAIGATFGAPDRTVCMFAGDGGFQMTIQELGTIMEQQCPVTWQRSPMAVYVLQQTLFIHPNGEP